MEFTNRSRKKKKEVERKKERRREERGERRGKGFMQEREGKPQKKLIHDQGVRRKKKQDEGDVRM